MQNQKTSLSYTVFLYNTHIDSWYFWKVLIKNETVLEKNSQDEAVM